MEATSPFQKVASHPPTDCCHGYEAVPEMFPDRVSLLKVVGYGLIITLLQFSVLVIIIAKPWQ
jgi:hypothetical protein